MLSEISEKDWKIFEAMLPDWQERYMDRLNREYIDILSSEAKPSQKFWLLQKRLNDDRQNTGVVCEMSRSKLVENIASLICEGAIAFDDLSGFSDSLKSAVRLIVKLQKDEEVIEEH